MPLRKGLGIKYTFIFFARVAFVAILVMMTGCSAIRHSVKKDKQAEEFIRQEREIGKEAEKRLKGDEKRVVEEAFKWLGTKYEFGRQDRGVATDCSGMVMRVYEEALDLKLPRNSAKQAEFCRHIKASNIKPGDLVFFITNGGDRINHVGIMIDGIQFIHASTKGVMVSSMESSYYKQHFQQYGRVPGMNH